VLCGPCSLRASLHSLHPCSPEAAPQSPGPALFLSVSPAGPPAVEPCEVSLWFLALWPSVQECNSNGLRTSSWPAGARGHADAVRH